VSGGRSGRLSRSVRRLRPAVKALGRRAGWLPPDTHTELVISVPCAAPALAGWASRDHLRSTEHHLTVLDPFVPSFRLDARVVAVVREVLAEFDPFSYELARVQRFPGVLYLAPEPAEPFIAITEALWRRFPEHPPYEGAFDAVVPHVTLALGAEPAGLAEHVAERLPVRGMADEVQLRMEDGGGQWGVAERFPLGRTS
jgi:hypothetical protein